jgi:hypothetical protein
VAAKYEQNFSRETFLKQPLKRKKTEISKTVYICNEQNCFTHVEGD